MQTPNHHLGGQGCPICKQSSGEKFVESILLRYNIPFKREVTFETKEIVRNTKSFRIDFVIEINEIKYFIEYHGLQHYEPVEFFGGEKAFIIQQKRDNYVKSFVNRNKNMLKLLELSYKLDIFTVEEKIVKFLNISQAPIRNNWKSTKNGELWDENTVLNKSISKGDLSV